MAHIKTTKGLDIPIAGTPHGPVQSLPRPSLLSLNLRPFETIRFKLLAKAGDVVKIGQPLLSDKSYPDRVFVSPASGLIKEVRRGHKRHPSDIVIQLSDRDEYIEAQSIHLDSISREELIKELLARGMFAHIRQRPFNFLADPTKIPRSIFVKAVESAPLTPPAELQVEGKEKEFAAGLQALSILTNGAVHLVYHTHTSSHAFRNAAYVTHHTVEGPHPIANHSVHIHHIDPIDTPEDVVWTVNALDVVCIGHALLSGTPYTQRVISIAGPGILEGKTGFFNVPSGYPISSLIAQRIPKGLFRYISGDPLTGNEVEGDDFLGFNDTAFVVIPEAISREFLHFFRLGINKYTASGTYLSGHLKNSKRLFNFTTSLHGEPRPFIAGEPSSRVMPMQINPMLLCKALMAQDFEQAVSLGLLEVDAEDFALPTFVDPSKVEMSDIVKHGLRAYATENFK
jgi:Na+-transporting NADH:ubiquinone oxidoreductase subunit A